MPRVRHLTARASRGVREQTRSPGRVSDVARRGRPRWRPAVRLQVPSALTPLPSMSRRLEVDAKPIESHESTHLQVHLNEYKHTRQSTFYCTQHYSHRPPPTARRISGTGARAQHNRCAPLCAPDRHSRRASCAHTHTSHARGSGLTSRDHGRPNGEGWRPARRTPLISCCSLPSTRATA